MNISRQDLDALNSIVAVTLETEDYLPQVEKALKSVGKKVEMKGFRKGMVPAGLVRKMYGTSVMVDELNKKVGEILDGYIKEQAIEILGQPLPKTQGLDFDIKDPQTYTFEFELGLSPAFELSVLSKSTVVKAPKVAVDDKQLNEDLDRLRSRYGSMSFPEDAIAEGDMLEVQLTELDGDKAKEGGVTAQANISTDMIKDEAVKAAVLSAKKGDSLTVDIYQLLDRSEEQVNKNILKLEATPADMNTSFQMTIERVSRTQKAELDQEFFDKVFGEGKVSSVEEAKEELKKDLSGYLAQSEAGKLNQKIFEWMLDNVSIELPDDFLKRWIKVTNEKPLTDEQLEEEYPAFAKNLRWSLIVNKIVKENDLKGTFEEIKEASKDALRQQLQQYMTAGGAFSEEDLETFNNSMLAKEDHVKKTYDIVMEQKLFNFIKEQISIEEEFVAMEDFFKS